MDKYKEALIEIETIRAENAWLDCMCRSKQACKLCQIRDIIKEALKE